MLEIVIINVIFMYSQKLSEINVSDFALIMQSKCEHPVKRYTRSGRLLFTDCGCCPSCFAKKRYNNGFRINQESLDPRNVYSWGVTYTYGDLTEFDPNLSNLIHDEQSLDDPRYTVVIGSDGKSIKTVPYLPEVQLKYIQQQKFGFGTLEPDESTYYKLCNNINDNLSIGLLTRFVHYPAQQLTYNFDNELCYDVPLPADLGFYTLVSSKKSRNPRYILNVNRGASAGSLRRQKNIALLNPYDLQNCIKAFRNQFDKFIEKNYPSLKGHILIRYFFHGEYGETTGKTHRPHYHGVYFLCCDSPLLAEMVRKDYLPELKFFVEKHSLTSWRFANRFWDDRKKMFVGKNIHDLSTGWAEYLGKYINKQDESKYCKGCLYVPEFTLCSRTNPKYGFGPIGGNYADSNYSSLSLLLEKCIYLNEYFNPCITYIDKDGKSGRRPVPSIIKKWIEYKYFGVTASQYKTFITYNNTSLIKNYASDGSLLSVKYKPYNRRSTSIFKYNLGIRLDKDDNGFIDVPILPSDVLDKCIRLYNFENSQLKLLLESMDHKSLAVYKSNEEVANEFFISVKYDVPDDYMKLNTHIATIDPNGLVVTGFCPKTELSQKLDKFGLKNHLLSEMIYKMSSHRNIVKNNINDMRKKAINKKFAHQVKNGYLL